MPPSFPIALAILETLNEAPATRQDRAALARLLGDGWTPGDAARYLRTASSL